MPEIKAKVFISCGQKKDTLETSVAQEIYDVLEEMGFDPYVAVQEQTLRGLKENIFSQLSESEYLIFIDFAREQIGENVKYRGSLFSHQELAIASYLELEVMPFQQRNVSFEGMMAAMQLNPIPFDDPRDLPKMISEEVKERGWRPDWKNIIQIDIAKEEFQDAQIIGTPKPRMARFFHLTVRNRNIRKIALSCTAYLEAVIKLPENVLTPSKTVELKWAGYTMPTVAIMPLSERELDAFYILHEEPVVLRFNCFSDSGHYLPPILGYGEYLLSYVVISENFPIARITVKATIGNSVEIASLELCS